VGLLICAREDGGGENRELSIVVEKREGTFLYSQRGKGKINTTKRRGGEDRLLVV